jgi:hypothetical protein
MDFGNSSGLLAAYGGSAIFYELQTLQPAAAKSATHIKSFRTAVGSEESRREET